MTEYEILSDEQLATLSLSSSEAFAVLLKRYENKLLFYVRRISGCRNEDAEDILQESFLKAYLNLRDFKNDLKFSSWIYRIVHNQAISYWRKQKIRPGILMDEESWMKIASLDQDMYLILKYRQDVELLKKVINLLPEKYRQVIILKYVEEKSYEEMADILRKPIGTIGTLVNRAKKILKELFNKYDGH